MRSTRMPVNRKVREHDDAPVAKPGGVLQRRFDQRKGHPGIGGLGPAEAETFPQHAGDLGDVGVGIGIRRAAPDHDEQRLVARHIAWAFGDRLLDALGGGAQHLGVDAEFAAIVDADAVGGSIGVEHRRDVVLGMAGGKQHARHRQYMADALGAQAVEAVAQDGLGELEIAVLDRIGQPPPRCSASTANSATAASSRLPWPHTRTPGPRRADARGGRARGLR
jgi:hypothetical protein